MRGAFLPLLLMLVTTSPAWAATSAEPVTKPLATNTMTQSWKQEGATGRISKIEASDAYALDKSFFIATTAMEAGFDNLRLVINALLVVLITVDLVALGALFLIQGGDLGRDLADRMFKYATWGVVIVAFMPAMNLIRWFFVSVGLVAGGAGQMVGGQLSNGPTALFLQALLFANPALKVFLNPPMLDLPFGMKIGDPGIMFMALLCYLAIVIPLIKIALQYAKVYLRFSALIGVAGLLLPFGLWGPTKDTGAKTLGVVYTHGVELLIFMFLYSVGTALFQSVAFNSDPADATHLLESMLGMVVIAILLAVLIGESEAMAQSLAMGTVSGTNLDRVASNVMKAGMMAAGGAAAMASSGDKTVGGAIKGAKADGVKGALGGALKGAGGSLGATGLGVLKGTITRLTRGVVKFKPPVEKVRKPKDGGSE